jgi:uncharacterized OB-fold protein
MAHSSIEADAPYWAALDEGRLSMPRGTGCGIWHWPAVARCGECGTWGPAWHDVAPEGTIFTWTRTWHPFGGTEGITTPFVTVVVSIDGAGGKRLMGLLEGDQAGLAIGAKVRGAIGQTRFGDRTIPSFHWRLAN